MMLLCLFTNLLISVAVVVPINVSALALKLDKRDKYSFYSDCLQAIVALPRDTPGVHLPTDFSGPRGAEPYSLPTTKQHDSCCLTVILESGYVTDKSSWADIRRTFGNMNKLAFNHDLTNVGDYAGSNGWIELWLDNWVSKRNTTLPSMLPVKSVEW